MIFKGSIVIILLVFLQLNSQNRDTVGAQEAAAFLKRSNLDINTLGQVDFMYMVLNNTEQRYNTEL